MILKPKDFFPPQYTYLSMILIQHCMRAAALLALSLLTGQIDSKRGMGPSCTVCVTIDADRVAWERARTSSLIKSVFLWGHLAKGSSQECWKEPQKRRMGVSSVKNHCTEQVSMTSLLFYIKKNLYNHFKKI